MVSNTNALFSPEHIRFLDYIRAVGTGPKGNRPLTQEETKDAFGLMLERRIPDTLISAFLLGWRVQGESDEELQGCVEWLAEKLFAHRSEGIEIGYPMDGKTKFPFLMLKAAEHLTNLPVHAVYDLPLGPKYGIRPDQFQWSAPNLSLHNRSDLLPELSRLTDMRNDIGIRTALNTLEKIYLLAPTALVGMHHGPYFDLYASLYGNRYKRLIIVQGHEGTPEILKKTKYKVIENNEVLTHTIDPEEFGIEPISTQEEMDLDTMQSLLDHPNENLQKMIRLNAAFLGWAGGLFSTIQEGWACLQD